MKKGNRLISHLAFLIDYSIISINRPTTSYYMRALVKNSLVTNNDPLIEVKVAASWFKPANPAMSSGREGVLTVLLHSFLGFVSGGTERSSTWKFSPCIL